MRRRARYGPAVAILVPLLLAATASLGAGVRSAQAATVPVVNAVDPHSGTSAGGTSVAIFGTGFTGATAVQFGTTQIFGFFVADDTRIFASSPPGSGVVDVKVSTGAGVSAASLADHYTYTSPGAPVVQAIDPRQGTSLGGTNVTVYGSGFSTATSATVASFGAFPCFPAFGPGKGGGGPGFGSCQINGDGSLIITTPPGSGAADITVTSNAGTSASTLADRFMYAAPGSPIVNAIGPNHGTANGGANVTIFGSGLSGAKSVAFGSSSIPACGLVAQPSARPLRVAGNQFIPAPAARRPAARRSAAASGPCFYASFSDSMLNLPTPPGIASTTPVDVLVTTGVGTSPSGAAAKYTYEPPGPLTVDALDPNHGSAVAGTSMSIFGNSFTGATAVNVGTTSLSACVPPNFGQCFSVNGDNNIFVYAMPPFSGTTPSAVHVTVTVGAVTSGTSPADQYTYETPKPPVIYAVDPTHASAAGGTGIYLYGVNFAGASDVAVGSTHVVPCTPSTPPPCFSLFLDGSIYLVAPPGNAGPTTITVTTATSPPASIAFTYDAATQPVIDVVSPNSGPANGGTTIWITGKALNGASKVTFGGVQAYGFFSAFGSENVMQVTSPPGTASTTPVDIEVTTPGGITQHTASDHFTYTNAVVVTPSVTAVSPSAGLPAGGTSVWISGTGFQSASGVAFGTGTQIPFCPQPPGGTACFKVTSDSTIQAFSPPGTASTTPVDIRVFAGTNPSPIVTDDHFTYTATPPPPPSSPFVDAVSPNRGSTAGGNYIQLYGGHFTGATGVQFGTAPPLGPCNFGPGSCFSVNSDSIIGVNTPTGSGTVDIKVIGSTTSSTTKADLFTFVVPDLPTINAVAPNKGPTFGGTQVQLYGTNLSSVDSVTFGTAAALPLCGPNTFQACFNTGGDTSLFVNGAPPAAAAGTVHITVHNLTGSSTAGTADQFTYFVEPAPVITGVRPNSGPSVGGTSVFITGSNMLGVNQITFGTNQVLYGNFFFTQSANVLQVTSPAGVSGTTVDITATNPTGPSAHSTADHFSYGPSPPPVITAVSPATGPTEGGTSVWISGTDLGDVFTVKFGANSSTNFFPQSPNLVYAASPPNATTGTVDITVMGAAGPSATTTADHFLYTATPAPVVTAISPSTGPTEGGTAVFISGRNLGNPTLVQFGTAASNGAFSPAENVLQAFSATVTTTGTVDVIVTTPSGSNSPAASDHFTYTTTPAPVVLAVGPSTGPAGTNVLISGTDFGGLTGVKFGGTADNGRRQPLSNQVVSVIAPAISPSPTAPVDVQVSATGGTSPINAPADQFTYTAPSAPTVVVISPNSGPAGTIVFITGDHLGAATAVNFGTTVVQQGGASGFFVRSDNLIRVPSPAGGTGTVPVTVTNSVGTSTPTADTQYTYGTAPPPTVFYFAEGYTGSGFSETLSLLMPKQSGTATIDYYLNGGVHQTGSVSLVAGKVTVVDVNAAVGAGKEVSAKVTLPGPGVAERTIHFNIPGVWHGSTGIVGTTAPSTEWDFAEGSTLTIAGSQIFSEFLTLQNPNASAVPVTLNYFTDTGLTPSKTLTLAANSRTTVEVFHGDTTNVSNCVPSGTTGSCGVGPGIGGVSVQVKSSTLPIIAERPFYVNNFSFGDGAISDGHDAFGANAAASTWNFAEGTTLGGFKEYLTLQNPGTVAATVSLNYFTDTGAHPVKTLTVNAHSRVTVEVFHGNATTNQNPCTPNGAAANCGVGPNIGGVSVQVTSTQPIVAERPMYMVLNFGTGSVAGAHVVVGATGLGTLFGFAAASTLAGENDYLTIQNPGSIAVQVTITYFANAGTVVNSFSVGPNTRVTVEVFRGSMTSNPACSPSAGTCGVGAGVWPLGIALAASQPILVEKPTYNSTAGAYGATDTLGYSPPSGF